MKVGAAFRLCFSISRNTTRFHIEETHVACSKAHRLHASDTPLKNARVVNIRVSAARANYVVLSMLHGV